MRVLFITRKYPPSVGGMQKISFGVINNFPEKDKSKLIAWGRSQIGLVLFIPWAFLKSVYLICLKKVDIVHFGDCALSFLAYFLKKSFGIPVVVTAHGLDLTYENKLYQWMIKKTIGCFDNIICVSNASRDIAISKGADPKKCSVIHNGLDTLERYIPGDRKELRKKVEKSLHKRLDNNFLLLTVGRLVKRKGVYWFIKHVFIELDKRCKLLIVGDGPEEQRIKELISNLRLNDRILMLGRVSDEILSLLYNSSDVFIMPNIPVPGDMEGFGIVAIEAASCGLPVIAANLEGIKDAIKDGQNGFLVDPYDVKGYVSRINEVMNMKNINKFRERQIRFIQENYDLKTISAKYYKLFENILKR